MHACLERFNAFLNRITERDRFLPLQQSANLGHSRGVANGVEAGVHQTRNSFDADLPLYPKGQIIALVRLLYLRVARAILVHRGRRFLIRVGPTKVPAASSNNCCLPCPVRDCTGASQGS